jgi:hypothetical protein
MSANQQAQQQLHMLTQAGQVDGGQSVFVQNPRDPMRGFYFGYFYFYFTNTAPFRAAGSVMPG